MAKFFKEDLNKSRKNKNSEKHEPGNLIADLNNLGKNRENEFLKGFPKTPAEIAQEEAEAREKAEAVARAEAEAIRLQDEENSKALLEAESQAERVRNNNKIKIVGVAENSQVEQVKAKKEKLKSEKGTILDKIMDSIILVENTIIDFFVEIGKALYRLSHCIQFEMSHLAVSIVLFVGTFKKIVGHKVNMYYKKNPDKRWERHQKNRKLMRQFILTRNNYIAKEKAAAARMVKFINHVDIKNEELADKTNVIVEKSNKKFDFAREWAELNKRKLLLFFTVVIAIAICCVEVFTYCTAYEYSYNGRTLGLVKKHEDVLRIVDIVSEQLSKEHNAEIYIDKNQDITFKRVLGLNADIDNTEDVLNRLTYMKNMSAKACGIYINNIRVAIVDNEENANFILDAIKDGYSAGTVDINYEKVDFKESIEIKHIDTKLGRIQNIDTVTQKLMTGAISQQVHTVTSGDTLSGIGKTYDMSLSELREANPDINPAKLSIGQEIVLTKPAPMVTIQTVEVATYPEPIPYETEYKDSSSLYKGESRTKLKGINGERLVTARITRDNGIQVAATVLESEHIFDPTTEVVIRGTKELPPLQGTGILKYPLSSFRLTSKFGPRWGTMHYGIDLAAPTGTTIRASDGGTVIYSGYSGSYGYVVKINHGGGMVTLYAHCSKLLVKKGDKVYQGQHIANVGSTGRSTGPHCHFQVEINGVPKNPLNYL